MDLIIFEDEHLLVINKPPGMNTHAPAPHGGEGIYDWLRHREHRWASLAIVHRLDKETSGLLVFTKTPLANRSLTDQFSRREVRKKYILVTDRTVEPDRMAAISALRRVGTKYVSVPLSSGDPRAETQFRVRSRAGGRTELEAEPITGRTHQIRVHAAEKGFPILGDVVYGGTPAERLWLHSAELVFRHPVGGAEVHFSAAPEFLESPRWAIRSAVIDSADTTAFRVVHGAADREPGWYVDRIGPYVLSHSEDPPSAAQMSTLKQLLEQGSVRGVYHKLLSRHIGLKAGAENSPRLLLGEAAPEIVQVLENGVHYELRFGEGYSVGLFFDQRENRRRLLTGYVSPGFVLFENEWAGRHVLNAFAYTCGFSLCAAKAGAVTTSVDLSKKYLDWGKRNFVLNGLDPGRHGFIFGDVFDWFRRLAKKGRQFDLAVLDPPTFSRTKAGGVFQVERHYPELIAAVLPLISSNGVLFASANAARLDSLEFVKMIRAAVESSGKRLVQLHYQPQPPDFPITRDEPAYLKTVWVRVG